MLKFIIRRLLISIPLLFGVSIISFGLIQLAPGDYFDTLKTNPLVSEETIEKYREQYHLDKPVHIQFFHWLKNLMQGDLGYSFIRKAPVMTIVKQRAGNTLILALTTLILAWLIAIPLGIISAVKHNTKADKIISFTALLGMSLPSFVIAILLLMFVANFRILPIGGMTSLDYKYLSWFGKIWDIAKHLIVPALAITILGIVSLIRITRANMLDVLRKPFVLSAHAQGLPPKIVFKHAFVNTINPLITILGYEFAGLLGGSAIIEIICNWPGLGSVMLDAVMAQDLFLVMGGIMISSVMLIIGNLLADILLAKLDPRIKF